MRISHERLTSEAIHLAVTMLAVFVAVFVEGQRQEIRLQEIANTARRAVDREMERNVEQFSVSAPYLRNLRCQLETIVRAEGNVGSVAELVAVFPDVSTAAWQAALVSAAGRYDDYEEWMQRVSAIYLLFDEYANARRGFFDHFARLSAWRIQNEGTSSDPGELLRLVSPVYGYMRILDVIHIQMLSRMTNPGSTEPIPLPNC